ncbi:hypothetical protein BT69DRAFT_1278930 [Atractiella rhizophila]|nr:hypothetical protein BT69DRAFT_1278930 [Atractiella rhizophila]
MYRDKDGERHHHHQRISGTTSRGSLTFLRGLWTSHRHHPRVGVIESQRYMDLEEALKNAADEVNLDELVELLKTSTATLVASLEKGVKRLIDVSAQLRSIGINPFRKRYNHEEELRRSEELLDQVKVALDDFRTTGRLKILEPYHYLFDPTATEKDGDFTVPSHRGIYLAYLYEYGLIRWSESFVSLFEKVLEVEKKGKHRRLSLPRLKKKLFTTHLSGDTVEDEDPNHVPGLQPTFITARRDPDTLPPRHLGQHIGHAIYRASLTITQREVVFGIKVAALVALVSLPAYLRASATFFNEQRGLWALILAATSAGQFVGDTVYAFCQRIISTFLGAVFGLAIWYTGCGSGKGNPYGIVAAAALYFVPVFYYRVYFPVPTTSVLGVITTALVVGYSWLDGQHPENNFNGTNFGVGWEIAWRRLLTVIIGVTAAFIWAYVPPSSTSKHFMRHGFGKIIQESGRHFCAVVSFLKHQSEPVSTVSPLLQHNWVALRSKIRNLSLSKSYINYELSIKGDWPEETYSELDRLSRSVLDIIQLFLDVTGTLPKTWRDALLNRVRFSDPCFISDITSVFYELSTSLNIGTPLPQFYNPLFEALVHIQYGFAIELTPEGIPKHLDIETIQSMEYVKFSVATSYATAIVNRLDRLMFIVKTLCGEDYRMIGDEEHERLLTNENDSQDSLV